MAMFCSFSGEQHKVRDVAPVTHYLRHQCTRCKYYAIFELCEQCAKEIEEYLHAHDRWDWWPDNRTFCPRCSYVEFAKKVWTVYENKEE